MFDDMRVSKLIIFLSINKLADCHANTVLSLFNIPVLIMIMIMTMISLATDALVVAIKRTRPRAIPLAMITMRKAKKLIIYVTHSFQAE